MTRSRLTYTHSPVVEVDYTQSEQKANEYRDIQQRWKDFHWSEAEKDTLRKGTIYGEALQPLLVDTVKSTMVLHHGCNGIASWLMVLHHLLHTYPKELAPNSLGIS